jgi:hypothetical protein
VPPSCKYTCRLYAMESAKTSSAAKNSKHKYQAQSQYR